MKDLRGWVSSHFFSSCFFYVRILTAATIKDCIAHNYESRSYLFPRPVVELIQWFNGSLARAP